MFKFSSQWLIQKLAPSGSYKSYWLYESLRSSQCDVQVSPMVKGTEDRTHLIVMARMSHFCSYGSAKDAIYPKSNNAVVPGDYYDQLLSSSEEPLEDTKSVQQHIESTVMKCCIDMFVCHGRNTVGDSKTIRTSYMINKSCKALMHALLISWFK